MPTPGKYVPLKERPVRLVVAMTISPKSVWKTVSLQYQIPDPKLPTLDTVGKNPQRARVDSDVTHDRVASDTTHAQIQLPNHEIFTTPTCTSHRSRYRWLHLPFGITSAPEEFQMRLTTALEGLEGIICIADDILVYGEGNDYKEAQKDHDRRFIALMERKTSVQAQGTQIYGHHYFRSRNET